MGASMAEDMAVTMLPLPSLVGGGKKCQRYLTGKLTRESLFRVSSTVTDPEKFTLTPEQQNVSCTATHPQRAEGPLNGSSLTLLHSYQL